MKYIINLTIVFDPENRLLMVRNNNQLKVDLSNPATRLLTELIENNKVELTREALIKHVWEDFGFSPSNATLSNHISELRKAFVALGVSETILITVPRVGFKMESEIFPECKVRKEPVLAEESDGIHSPCELGSDATATTSLIDIDTKKLVSAMRVSVLVEYRILIALVLVALTIIAIYALMIRDDETSLIGIQGTCSIYTLDEDQPSVKHNAGGQNMLNEVKNIIADEKIDCSQINHDLYYMASRPDNELFKVHLLVVCTLNDKKSYANCNNYRSAE